MLALGKGGKCPTEEGKSAEKKGLSTWKASADARTDARTVGRTDGTDGRR